MSVLAQHGYGKSDKIERALAANLLNGVILSPKDETPERLEEFVNAIAGRFGRSVLFIDPQFYVSTITSPRVGRLDQYEYFRSELQYRDFRGTAIAQYVREVLGYQRGLAVSHLCSPTVSFDTFGDRWNAIALSLAGESIRIHEDTTEERPLLISLVVHEQAFRAREALNDFLDLITEFDCDGFYIVVRHERPEFSLRVDPATLAGLMYLVYTLCETNGYEVYVGYSDFAGLPLHAVGVTGSASGWQQGLRRFTFARFEPATGGRAARPRYASLPLLNSVTVTPELDQIAGFGHLQAVLTGTAYDEVLNVRSPGSADWPNDVSALQHWAVLHGGIERLLRRDGIAARLDHLAQSIQQADRLYQRIVRAGVTFEGASAPGHLADWHRGIDEFRARADV